MLIYQDVYIIHHGTFQMIGYIYFFPILKLRFNLQLPWEITQHSIFNPPTKAGREIRAEAQQRNVQLFIIKRKSKMNTCILIVPLDTLYP